MSIRGWNDLTGGTCATRSGDPLAELLLSGRIKDGEKVKITAGRDCLVFNGATVAAAA
jgi:hypothetical protein